MCRECGCVPTCNHCSTALTYHERTHTLQCHTCGSSWRVQPYPAPTSRCPKCGSRYLAKMGLGTQQIEDALHQMLPQDVAIIRMDADSTRGKDAHKKLLEQFDAADCAVLLGTQMIAKGLDFPEVTLVGVVNADFALKLPDFRAGERAYDLLEQVAGRAGRGDRPGEVIIQTYLPEDPVIRAVAEHDRSIFTDYDLDQRRGALYPPFVRLINILVWSASRDDAQDYIGRIAKLLKRRWHAAATDFLRVGSAVPQVLGPASCVIERAKDRYRFHLLVKSPVGYHVSDDIDACLKEVGSVSGVSVSVDVDAYDLMSQPERMAMEANGIVLSPDPRLRQECAVIEEITPAIEALAEKMKKMMDENGGCGLAAPQIGELIQLVTIDCDYSDKNDYDPYVLINPVIVEQSDHLVPFSEGCLSIPGIS